MQSLMLVMEGTMERLTLYSRALRFLRRISSTSARGVSCEKDKFAAFGGLLCSIAAWKCGRWVYLGWRSLWRASVDLGGQVGIFDCPPAEGGRVEGLVGSACLAIREPSSRTWRRREVAAVGICRSDDDGGIRIFLLRARELKRKPWSGGRLMQQKARPKLPAKTHDSFHGLR